MLNNFRLILIFFWFPLSFHLAQLEKLSGPNLYSDSEIYLDENKNWYSTSVVVNFASNTINLKNGITKAKLSDIQSINIVDAFEEIEKKYGVFTLEKLFPDASPEDTIGEDIVTGEKVILRDESQFYKLNFEKIICIETLITELIKIPGVKNVDKPFAAISTYTPSDYSASEQWALDMIEATKAWDITTGSEQVNIGISDQFSSTDINNLHIELRNNKVIFNPNNYSLGHGQITSGCASALTDNNLGIASIGYNTKLMFGAGNESGIRQLRANGAHIINCSWISAIESYYVETAIYNALKSGVIITATVGNSQEDLPNGTIPFVTFPGAYNFPDIGRQVIAVTSTYLDNNSEFFPYSSSGRWNYSPGTDPVNYPYPAFVDVSAPGVSVKCLSKTNSEDYDYYSGTSISAPIVAGLIALIRSIYPSLTPEIAYKILVCTTDKVGNDPYSYTGLYNQTWNQYMGYGRINAYKALKYTLENYGGTLSKSLTIPSSGTTWNFQPGVSINFGNGASLIVRGQLYANGTSSRPIVFTSSEKIPGKGDWAGIRFLNSNCTSVLNYCEISYATNGIYLDNSNLILDNSYIHHNQSSNLSVVNGAYSSMLWYNTMSSSTYGIYAINDVSLHFSLNNVVGGNSMHNNTVNLTCSNNCYIFLGSTTYPCYNSLYNCSSPYSAFATGSSEVKAEKVWWGTSNENDLLFLTDGSSEIDYSPCLTSNPGIGSPLESIISTSNIVNFNSSPLNSVSSASHTMNTTNPESLYETGSNYYEESPDKAIEYWQSLIESFPESDYATRALVRLYHAELDSTKTKLSSYLDNECNSILNKTDIKSNRLAEKAMILKTYKTLRENDLITASNLAKQMTDSYSNSQGELYGLYTLATNEDMSNSIAAFKQLKKNYPDEVLTLFAREMRGEKVNWASGQTDSSKQIKEDDIEQEYALSLTDNYPNPFNPATIITFTLPESDNIQLIVYDILGREVKKLANGLYQAGKHKFQFNAYDLASGVYIYKLKTSTATLTKKMMLLK